MRLRAGPEASLRVWLLFVGVLAELAAGPTLSLDWIYDVLPSGRGRRRHIDCGLEIGIGSANV